MKNKKYYLFLWMCKLGNKIESKKTNIVLQKYNNYITKRLQIRENSKKYCQRKET